MSVSSVWAVDNEGGSRYVSLAGKGKVFVNSRKGLGNVEEEEE